MRICKKILIIDDSVWIIERLLLILENVENISAVEYAISYKEATRSIEQVKPDILFLDINLPDTNGIEMLKIFRKKYPEMKIIMFTIHTDSFYRDFCKNLGADYFINKSEEFEIIPRVISEISNEIKVSTF